MLVTHPKQNRIGYVILTLPKGLTDVALELIICYKGLAIPLYPIILLVVNIVAEELTINRFLKNSDR